MNTRVFYGCMNVVNEHEENPSISLINEALALVWLYLNVKLAAAVSSSVNNCSCINKFIIFLFNHHHHLLDTGLSNFSPSRSIFGYSHPAPANIVTPPSLRASYTTCRLSALRLIWPANCHFSMLILFNI
jgi:hypothetical protein